MKIRFAALFLLQVLSPATADQLRTKRDLQVKLPKSVTPAKKAATKRLIKALKRAKQLGPPPGAGGSTSIGQGGSGSSTTAPSPPPFNPETDDPDWPGAFPSSLASSKEELILNFREDDFPEELYLSTRVVFSLNNDGSSASSAQKTYKGGKTKQGVGSAPGERKLVSIPIDFFNATETLYQIEVTDIMGDGICCGPFGNGWITVTNRSNDVLWSAVGNYTYIATAYLWKDIAGKFSVVGTTNPMAAMIPPGQGGTNPGQGGPVDTPPGPVDTPTGPVDQPTFTPVDTLASPTPSPTVEQTEAGGDCSLCPSGSTGTPTKEFILGDEPISCNDMEGVYTFGLTSEECAEFEEGGITDYYRALCSCPGYEPSCAMCNGNPVMSPDNILPSDEPPELACKDFEIYFLTLSASQCSEWDSATIGTLEEFCGCP